MPITKEAIIRYKIIDECLTNRFRRFPSMEDLIDACEKELGTDFAVSTIQKDIKTMKEDEALGYLAPIKFSKAENGYYYSDPEYTIRSFGLNDKEIEAIEFATSMLQHFRGMKVNESFNQAVDKILTSVKAKKSDKESALLNAIQLEETTTLRGIEELDKYIYCIKEKVPISFVHYSYDKKTFKANIIHPYLLKESNKRWYLVGFSEEHNDVRYFGIDRVYDPVFLDKRFIEHKGKDLRRMFSQKIGLNDVEGYEVEQTEEIQIWVSRTFSNYLKSMPLHHSQKIIEYYNDGELLINLHLVPTLELISKILSYGEHMVVKEPKWLADEVKNEFAKALKKYKS